MANTPNIDKILHNYNAKVRRLEKSNKSNIIIPKKITKQEFLNSVYTKRETNLALKDLQKFLVRGAENTKKVGNITLSNYEHNLLKAQKSRARYKLKNKIEAYNRDVKILGSSQGYPKKMLMDNTYENLIAKQMKLSTNIRDLQDRQELKEFMSFLGAQTKSINVQFRENYYKMLRVNAQTSGFDTEKIEEIIKKLNKVNNNNFFKMYNDDERLKLFLERYDVLTKNISNAKNSDNDLNKIYIELDELYKNIDNVIKDYI